ncbi:hypothetical protein BS78_K020700 [Paspalum vaginatum]|uniref:Uncharacterized protein n=1 Tax=Paspalum vaginatum TaxID=158149 RepID=A0A9W7XD75_9POAL|nr:hypothetical protein BS78_K020700 [Paspalum vaginatum]
MDEDRSNNNIAGGSVGNMEEWVNIVEKKRKFYVSMGQTVRPIRDCLICRVPQKILELDRNAYEPISLAIGPYHHGKPVDQILVEKWKCLNYILRENPEKTLQDYLELMESVEQQARSCYPEEFALESDEFVKMLLLDGCLVLVALRGIQGTNLLRPGAAHLRFVSGSEQENFNKTPCGISVEKIVEKKTSSTTQSKFAQSVALDRYQQHAKHQVGFDKSGCLTALLLHDLFLLENQLPFFVVKKIYESVTGEYDSSKLIYRIGCGLVNIIGYPVPIRETSLPNVFHHLLHFWHLYMTPAEDTEEPQEHHRNRRYKMFPSYLRRYEKLNIGHNTDKSKVSKNINSSRFPRDRHHLLRWRRAEQYHEAGVHFQKRVFNDNDRYGLLDIRFTNGLIEIPTLVISWHTSSFFKNIIALEQTCPEYGNYFTSYCAFLSQIVTKPADVVLLAKTGILVHHMRSDDEVSALLTKLGKNVDLGRNDSHYLKSVCRRMEEHYQSRTNRWMAWLWHNHFSNPWLSLAVLAAAIVLLCTILQTLFAFMAYFNPPKA